MRNYYFTFDSDDKTISGESLKGYWVRVIATNWTVARKLFMENFAKPVMGDYGTYFAQWHEDHFTPDRMADYKFGEYLVIDQSKGTTASEQLVPSEA